jgi:hypothetical protein
MKLLNMSKLIWIGSSSNFIIKAMVSIYLATGERFHFLPMVLFHLCTLFYFLQSNVFTFCQSCHTAISCCLDVVGVTLTGKLGLGIAIKPK